MPEEDTNSKSILTDVDNNLQAQLIETKDRKNRFDSLTEIKIFAYGVGHFINDLVAACWFNYLLYFLKTVVQTPAASAALLAGQLADGIATPIVGYFSDKTKTKYGQRTPWYVFGLVLVVVCYIPIYQTFQSENKTNQYIYYTIFPALFNVGWAALQISHMSLVPSLTCSRKRRDRLNNLRNTFTFISNFVVLVLGLIIFKAMSNPPIEYSIISIIVAILGIATSVLFLYHVRQVPLSDACHTKAQYLKQQLQYERTLKLGTASSIQFSEDQDNIGVHQSKRQLKLKKTDSILDWFKMPKFYLFGICYMGVRLSVNIFGTFLPFYLTRVLRLGYNEQTKGSSVPFTVALVPLIVYLFSTGASLKLNWFYNKFGRKIALSAGTLILVASLLSMLLLKIQSNWVMYIIAIFIGVSQTMVLSTGINFISDVVGTKAKTGAFVFGIYSLLDKFSAGIVIFIISSTTAYTRAVQQLDEAQISFIKYTMILIPAGAAILATLIVVAYPVQEYSKNKLDNKVQRSSIEEELVA